MSDRHQTTSTAPWQQRLAAAEAQTLAAAAERRWLTVDDGSLWLTPRDSHGQRDDDIWLARGDVVELPPRSAWVLQAWPHAVFGIHIGA